MPVVSVEGEATGAGPASSRVRSIRALAASTSFLEIVAPTSVRLEAGGCWNVLTGDEWMEVLSASAIWAGEGAAAADVHAGGADATAPSGAAGPAAGRVAAVTVGAPGPAAWGKVAPAAGGGSAAAGIT